MARYAYIPRKPFIAFHNREQREALLVCHRRMGKTVALVNDLIIGGAEEELARPQLAYIGPTYTQVKRTAWEYLKEYSRPMAYGKPNETELRVDIYSRSGTPARIFLAGADNPDSLRGIYLDGAVLDEAAQIKPSVKTQIILPALADRKGWLVESSTPLGKNHFYASYQSAKHNPQCFTMLVRASESGLIPQEELDRLKRSMDEDEYLQEMECSFDAAIRGAILGRLVAQARASDRVNHRVTYDPMGAPIEVSSDIGFRDTTAFWFWQPRLDGFALVHYMEGHGMGPEEWARKLNETGLRIHTLWLPQDAKARTMAASHSVEEQFLALGFPVTLIPMVKVQDRIAAARAILPKCYFNEICEPGLEALASWSYTYNEDSQSYSAQPKHDWASHAGDAFSYGAVVIASASPSMDRPEWAGHHVLTRKPKVLRAIG